MPKKIAIIATSGNEDIELIAPADIWRRAGIEVDILSIDNDVNLTLAHGTKIIADKLHFNANINEYDAVFFPGGAGYVNYAKAFSKDGDFVNTLREKFTEKEDKFIIAICAAPDFLAQVNLINFRNATCYTGFQKRFEETYQHVPVCSHQNLITASSCYYAIDLALEVVKQLVPNKYNKLRDELLVNEYDSEDSED